MFKDKKVKVFGLLLVILIPIVIIILNIKTLLSETNELQINESNFSLEINYKRQIYDIDVPEIELVKAFDSIPNTALNSQPLEFGPLSVWHLLQVKNVSREDLSIVLLMDNPTLNHLDIYKLAESNNATPISFLGSSADVESFSHSAIPRVNLELGKKEELTLLIRSQTDGSPNVPFTLFYQSDFERYKDATYFLWGGFIAIVLLMSIYNLILYLGNNESIYIYYVAYILLFLTVFSVTHGFGVYIFPTSVFHLIKNNLIFFYYWLGLCLTAFTLYFLQLNKAKNSIIHKVTLWFMKLLVVLSIVSLFFPEYESAQTFFPVQSVIYILCLFMLAKTLKKNANWAKLYAVSWLPLLAGAAVGTLYMLGKLDYNFFNRHAAMLSVMFEMAFISMALAERLRVNEFNRLYHATHDDVFDLPNEFELRARSEGILAEDPKQSFSLLLVEIDNYNVVSQLVDKQALKEVTENFLLELEFTLNADLMMLELDPGKQVKYTSIIAPGTFGILVSSNDTALLQSVLIRNVELTDQNFYIDNLNIHFTYKIGIATFNKTATNMDSLIKQAKHALKECRAQQQTFTFYNRQMEDTYEVELQETIQLQRDIKEHNLEINLLPIKTEILNNLKGLKIELVSPRQDTVDLENLINKDFKKALLAELTRYKLNVLLDIEKVLDKLPLATEECLFVIEMPFQMLESKLFEKQILNTINMSIVRPHQLALVIKDNYIGSKSRLSEKLLDKLVTIGIKLIWSLESFPNEHQEVLITTYFNFLSNSRVRALDKSTQDFLLERLRLPCIEL